MKSMRDRSPAWRALPQTTFAPAARVLSSVFALSIVAAGCGVVRMMLGPRLVEFAAAAGCWGADRGLLSGELSYQTHIPVRIVMTRMQNLFWLSRAGRDGPPAARAPITIS